MRPVSGVAHKRNSIGSSTKLQGTPKSKDILLIFGHLYVLFSVIKVMLKPIQGCTTNAKVVSEVR